MPQSEASSTVKRPVLLTIWLSLLLLLDIVITGFAFTYIPMVLETQNYFPFIQLAVNFIMIAALIMLFKWQKMGFNLYLVCAVFAIILTGINQLMIGYNLSEAVPSLIMITVIHLVLAGVLYLAMRPVWTSFR